MEVLLSKLSYRLYELESYSLSYDFSPVESLIDIREGLDWLSANAAQQFELMSLNELLDSFLRLVAGLQHELSPFNFKFRDLLLEFIDLARQLILEQDFYLSFEPNLATKSHQITLISNKIDLLSNELTTGSNLAVNVYESDVDQDNDYWLNDLIDFIERFSRVGAYYFEGGLNFKPEGLMNEDVKLILNNTSSSLVLGVKTSQSLAWMKHNFNKFRWNKRQDSKLVSPLNLASLFKGFRHANELLGWREKKRFKYSNYYKELESVYLASQSLTLKQAAKQLSSISKLDIEVMAYQSSLYVDLDAFDKLKQSLAKAINLNSCDHSFQYYLSLKDCAGCSYLSLEEVNELGLQSESEVGLIGGPNQIDVELNKLSLSVSVDLDVLEHSVWQMNFANEVICVPDHKIHSIQIFEVRDFESCDNFSIIQMTFDSIGTIDVFVAPHEQSQLEGDARVVLIEEVGRTYGILVTDMRLQRRAYKVASKGVNAKVTMLWCLGGENVVPEINPCAYEETSINLIVKQDDIRVDKSGWLAKVAGVFCFIGADIVEKHLPVTLENVVNLPGISLPLAKLEGVCYPYLDIEKELAISLVLLTSQDKYICLPVEAIYYEADMSNKLQSIEGIDRLDLREFSLLSSNYDANLLYVIDSNSFG